MKKLVIAFILTLVLMLGMCAVVSAEADTTNDIPDTATNVSFDSTYMGTLSETSATDWYKFTVPASGKVNIKVTTSMRYTWYSVFSSDNLNSKLWGNDYTNGLNTELYLIAGDYYFSVGKYYDYGDYTLNISYTSANESFEEQIGVSNNNSFTVAQEIVFGADYTGQLAINDTNDYYKFVITESGRINLKVTTTMEYTWYELYNASEVKVWGDDYTKGVDAYLHLTAGTYYLRVAKNYNYGNYTFKVNFESAKESFEENESTGNNSYEYASSIAFGTDYTGQLAINDTDDYYKFVITESGRINLKVTTTMEYTWYELHNASEVKVWGDDYTKGVDAYVHLKAGTYYLKVAKNYNYGNYGFKVSFESAGESFAENENTNNNSLESASSILLGTEYKGHLALNDKIDYYGFTVTTPQIITISASAAPDYKTSYGLYDANGAHLWGGGWRGSFVADTEMLEAGTYYFAVGYDDIYGTYSFKLLEQHTCNSDEERITPATCTENGRIDKICTICGKVSISEDIPAAHTFGGWVVETPMVCNESNGVQARTCTVCEYVEREEIMMSDHQMNADGVCSICGSRYTPTSGGCSMVLGGSAIVAAVTVLGAAVTVLKKKRED